ncbi:opine dehydrogenase [Azorhizobium oxalatiphilum]|uniref:Opine dehydrogenase n=1 Tax=Azorhizobium oxalatiphilum TaxID=980631 RepID=A0A917C3J9_9HYPH|nr:NAD/NADP-dependent octopine/nopaline dehydrogenase family protein [Azorhizobium oxalatiphilum]GGF68314.1 opine dehydrogenase [Azorhizobium oxalatiphilum]
MTLRSLKVAVLGAGSMGLATSALLASRGHAPIMWSPSGGSTHGLAPRTVIRASGALAGEWEIGIAASLAEALGEADAVVLAVDGGGHRPVMEAAAPLLRPGVPFIIGAAHSMGAVALSALLAARDISLPIISWNTTVATAHKTDATSVDIRTVRPRIEAAVMPARDRAAALDLCHELTGALIEPRGDALAIALLSNSNPVFHVPVCLLNISRIEHRESWAPYGQTTEAVGRLMEALDAERIAVAQAYGSTIHSLNEHFHRSFRTPLGPMAQMNATLFASGRGPKGPRSVDHRYISQDLSYGLVFAAEVARLAGVATPVHDATITLAGASIGRDYKAENTLLEALKLEGLSVPAILQRATNGFFET